jgi:hypothetical protein
MVAADREAQRRRRPRAVAVQPLAAVALALGVAFSAAGCELLGLGPGMGDPFGENPFGEEPEQGSGTFEPDDPTESDTPIPETETFSGGTGTLTVDGGPPLQVDLDLELSIHEGDAFDVVYADASGWAIDVSVFDPDLEIGGTIVAVSSPEGGFAVDFGGSCQVDWEESATGISGQASCARLSLVEDDGDPIAIELVFEADF